MPLIKSPSRAAFVSNLKAELAADKPRDQALAIAYSVKRRSRAGGGGIFDYSGVGEAMPENIGRENILDPMVQVPKRMLWDLPHEAIESAKSNPMPGLRREDYTDISGTAQPVDPMVGASLETAVNAAGAPLVRGTAARAAEATLGTGAVPRRPVTDLSHIDDIIAREKALTNEPRPAEPVPAEAAPAADPGDVGPGGGGPTGARGLPEAQATAARWAGERASLEGIPGPLKIGESHFVPGPIGKVHDVAEDYMRTVHPDRPYTPPTRYHPIDPEHSAAIARAYEEMPHTPNDPATKASYNALIDETAKQYDAIKKTGLKIEPIPPGMPDPYATNPRMAAIDVAENNHLWFFPTEGGFGTVNKITDNPMLRPTGEKIGEHEMLANDMFRVVHDYFGHLKEGHGFRAPGEDNAWRTHAQMYSDLARPAMTTETRGQNSWVNYGPHGEKNRTASGANTTYADQKVGLMPEWTMRDRGSPEPIIAYHGSPYSFDRFSSENLGAGEGNQAYGHGLYFAGHSPVSEWYRHQLAARRDPLIEKYGLDPEQASWLGTHLHSHAGDVDRAVADIDKQIKNLKYEQSQGRTDLATANMIKDREAKVAYLRDPNRNPGTMYQVAIDRQPEHFLDYDKPISQQSPEVQEVLRRQAEIAQASDQSGPRRAGKHIALHHIERNSPAGDVLRSVRSTDPESALKKAGVPGIRYLDQGSRLGGAGTHNYVTFDDSMLRILRKYGIAGIPAAGVLGADGEERHARGGRIARRLACAGGGAAFGVMSPAEEAELDEPVPYKVGRAAYKKLGKTAKRAFQSSESMRRGEGYDPGPILHAAALPMGAAARGVEMVSDTMNEAESGDGVDEAMEVARKVKRAKGGKVAHVGPIVGNTGGRADKRPMEVPDGCYICTADHVSGLGEGNSGAGMKKLGEMFPKSKPSLMRKLPKSNAVKIFAADGEFCISPQDIMDRFGDLDHGHKILDKWQTSERQKLIETLKGLDPPAQD